MTRDELLKALCKLSHPKSVEAFVKALQFQEAMKELEAHTFTTQEELDAISKGILALAKEEEVQNG